MSLTTSREPSHPIPMLRGINNLRSLPFISLSLSPWILALISANTFSLSNMLKFAWKSNSFSLKPSTSSSAQPLLLTPLPLCCCCCCWRAFRPNKWKKLNTWSSHPSSKIPYYLKKIAWVCCSIIKEVVWVAWSRHQWDCIMMMMMPPYFLLTRTLVVFIGDPLMSCCCSCWSLLLFTRAIGCCCLGLLIVRRLWHNLKIGNIFARNTVHRSEMRRLSGEQELS